MFQFRRGTSETRFSFRLGGSFCRVGTAPVGTCVFPCESDAARSHGAATPRARAQLTEEVKHVSMSPYLLTAASVSRCQIDHRSSHTPTQAPDRDGVDGVQELDGVHGDLRSEAKCTGEMAFQREPARRAPRGRPLPDAISRRPRRILKWVLAKMADRAKN